MKREMIFMQIVDDFAHHRGYGTTPRDCIVMGARCPKIELKFNRSRDMMIDLVSVKPSKRVVHVFRFGCGGPKSELEFTY